MGCGGKSFPPLPLLVFKILFKEQNVLSPFSSPPTPTSIFFWLVFVFIFHHGFKQICCGAFERRGGNHASLGVLAPILRGTGLTTSLKAPHFFFSSPVSYKMRKLGWVYVSRTTGWGMCPLTRSRRHVPRTVTLCLLHPVYYIGANEVLQAQDEGPVDVY